ncbi:MAG: ATP synthase F1 subunit gamma [Lachnospiraceae bacterium]|nr:ATP synthase F1 subunit gamma [Lachnospiraceae bacterium]
MASMRDIKRRKVSIQSTQQITKAMKLTSTVKLQKAKTRAEQSKPYFDFMYETVNAMLAKSGNIDHPYLQAKDTGKTAIVVITSNRGLAGGYNNNIIKLVTESGIPKEDVVIYTVGTKGRDALARRNYDIKEDYSDIIEEPQYSDANVISRDLLDAFEQGEIKEIYLAYTFFKNTVSHDPRRIKLLPVEIDSEETQEKGIPMNYEPEEEEALDLIIPKYITSMIYGALMQAVASENGARMQAMDSATSNAEEMIDSLSLLYNRARQGSITQELTEIIAGADAIS